MCYLNNVRGSEQQLRIQQLTLPAPMDADRGIYATAGMILRSHFWLQIESLICVNGKGIDATACVVLQSHFWLRIASVTNG